MSRARVTAVGFPGTAPHLGCELRPACVTADPRVFFPEDVDGSPLEDGPEADAARGICARCPLRDQCLEYAVGVGMPAGIWGGLSTRERERIRGRLGERGAA
jgi:WhiB family redox-sensing transcriptional regulator